MKHGTGKRFKLIAEKLFDDNISEMARAMDMTPQSFNKYAQGETLPGGVILKRVIAIGVNLNWLIAGIPPMLISEIQEAGVKRFDYDPETSMVNDQFETLYQAMPDKTQDLLSEVEQFSDFLKELHLPVKTKRYMLQLMVEHIDQEIGRLETKPS